MIGKVLRVLSVGLLGLSLLESTPKTVSAQMDIRPDTTLAGEASTLDVQGNTTLIEGGATRNINLFHSFDEFNIDEGQAAYFIVDDINIENIFSRITGDDPSDILGVLGTCTSNPCSRNNTEANLYLINPNGILFGTNSELDIGGSFVSTTANAIRFGDQGDFDVSDQALPLSLTINPSAFLFDNIGQESSSQIENQSRADSGLAPSNLFSTFGLRVPDGKSILLLGGDININGGGIVAFGGRIDIGGVEGSGQVNLTSENNVLSLSFPENTLRADISLTDDAGLLVAAGGGGSVSFHSRNLSLSGDSSIQAGIIGSLGTADTQSGDITIDATESILLNNSFIESIIFSGGTGNGGRLDIASRELKLINTAAISSDVQGRGNAGDLTINTERIFLENSIIRAFVNGIGTTGNQNIYASDLIELKGEIIIGDIFSPGGFLNQVNLGGQGSSGNLSVETNRLSVSDGSKIQTTTFGDASNGRVGNVDIQAREIEIFETPRDNRFSTGIFGGVQIDPRNVAPPSGGNGGNVNIQTERLSIRGGRVATGTSGIGSAGNLLLQASDSVELIDNFSETGSLTFIGAAVGGESTGQGGNLTVEAGKIRLFGNSDIRTNVFAEEGSGGNITLIADSIVAFDDSDIFAFAQEGRGGNITLDTPAFFGENYQPSAPGQRAEGLDLNDAVNINASGTTAGIVTLPDTIFIQNELVELSNVLVNTDALVASSCVARRNDGEGSFVLTNLNSPSDSSTHNVGEVYNTGNVQPIDETSSQSDSLYTNSLFIEPQRIYQTNDGRLLMSLNCQ